MGARETVRAVGLVGGLAGVVTGRGPGGARPVVLAVVGAVAVLLALRFAARLIDQPRPSVSSSPVDMTPEAPATSPQWTGVRG